MLGSNSQYHKEHDDSFADKISALAKYAGIAAVGLGSVAYLAPRTLGSNAANALSDQSSTLRRILGPIVGVHDTKTLFSDTFNYFADSVPQVRRSFLRGAMRDIRREALTESLRKNVHEDSLEHFDKIAPHLTDVFHEFLSGEVEHMSGKLLSDSTMQRFMESTKGVRFNYMTENVKPAVLLEQHRASVKQSMDDAIDLAKRRQVSTEKNLFGGKNGSKNRDVIFGALAKHAREMNASEKAGLDLQGMLHNKNHRGLTIEEITGSHREKVDQYLRNTGHKKTADEIFGKIESNLIELGGEQHAELREAYLKSFSGLGVDKNGDVLSLVHARNSRRTFVNRAKQALQFPLQPIKFNIPFTLGGAYSPDKTPVKFLGEMSKLGELKRMGLNYDNEFGLSIGEQIFSFGRQGTDFTVDRVNAEQASRFIFLNNERSTVLKEMAGTRANLLDNAFSDFSDQVSTKGFLKAAKESLQRPEGGSKTVLENLLHHFQPELFNLNVNDGELKLVPKNIMGSLAGKILGVDPTATSVTSDQIHPTLISQFLKENTGKITPNVELDLQRRMIGGMANLDFNDLSPTVKKLASKARKDGIPLSEDLIRLMELSDNPEALADHLGTMDLEALSNNQVNSTLEKALSDFIESPNRIYDISAPAQNKVELNSVLTPPTKEQVFGDDAVSKIQKDLQRGLIEEFTRASAKSELFSEVKAATGLDQDIALNLLKERGTLIDPTQIENANKIKGIFTKHLNVSSDSEFNYLFEGALKNFNPDEGSLSEGSIGQLVTAFSSHERLAGYMEDPVAKMIAAERVRSDTMLVATSIYKEEQGVSVINRLVNNLGIHDKLDEGGFRARRPSFVPEAPEEAVARYTVLPSATPSMGSLIIGNGLTYTQAMAFHLKTQLGRGFGTVDFAKGLFSANSAQGYLSTSLTALSHGAANVLDQAGLGISETDKATFGRAHTNLMIKRIIPAYIAMEAYKNINADLHNKDQEGIDDFTANVYGNARISTSKFRDRFGLTNPLKHLVYSLPGADMYYNPMDEAETREDLLYGNEQIRMGRGFLIGSRNPAYGGSVESVRPNLYRRLKSHWTEARNVQLSNPNYSFLPTITNPLAPLNALFHPHWQEDLTQKDRPYASEEEMLSYLDEHPSVGYAYEKSHTKMSKVIQTMTNLWGYKKHGMPGPGGSGPGTGGSGSGYGGGGGSLEEALQSAEPGDEDGRAFNYGYNKYASKHEYHKHKLTHKVHEVMDELLRPTGIYSGIVNQIPAYGSNEHEAFQIQDPGVSFSKSRLFYNAKMGEVFPGMYGEFFRRFMPEERQDPDAFNPLQNNQASWLPNKFRRGDPYARLSNGELILPGDAMERANPFVKPLKIRGSMVGLSEDEMVLKFLDPIGSEADEASETRMAFGTFAHKRIMRQMREQGILVGAEIAAYDDEINGSATIETLVRGKSGLEVVEIKTRGSGNINEDNEKYIDQLMYYMYLTDTKVGHLAHVNRDNPDEVRLATYKYDPKRMDAIFNRVAGARARVQEMIDNEEVSPYETYGLIDRIEVLAKAAPESREFRKYVQLAKEKGGFGGMEQRRFEIALEIAKAKTENYNLYPKRNVPTETRDLVVEAITGEGDILTEMGQFKLAGVKYDQQAFAYKDPADLLAQYGIHVGQKTSVTLIKGQFNPDVTKNTVLEAIFGDVNHELIESEYADEDYKSRNPLANQVFGRDGLGTSVTDTILHSDNMFSNKFLRVRTALEQYKRGEVYGTDEYSLKNLKDNYVVPTVNSIISKNPVVAGAQSALVASIFFRTKKMKGKAAMVAGAVGASLSLLKELNETLTGETWKPKRTRKRNDFDEYYDILTYVKESTIAEAALKAKNGERQVKTGHQQVALQAKQFEKLASDAEFKARRTMYGFDVVNGTLDEALATLPRRHRQIAESIITTATQAEKDEYYDLLPNAEKRVLGKFLGVEEDKLPTKPNLTEYFKHHNLPKSDWGGWRRDTDLDDIKLRATEHEDIKIARPSKRKLAKAKVFSEGVEVPRMNKRTKENIQRELDKLAGSGEFGNILINYETIPTSHNVIDINMQLNHDRRAEVEREKQKQLRR